MFYFWLTTISSHDAQWRKTKVFIILTWHNQLSNGWMKSVKQWLNTLSLKLSVKNSLLWIKLSYNENVAKQSTKTQWKWRQSQNTHVEVNIFARQKSKAQSRVWIVQNNLHIAETCTKGTSAELDWNFSAEMKLHTSLHTSFYWARRAYIKILFMMAQ